MADFLDSEASESDVSVLATFHNGTKKIDEIQS